MLKIKDGAQYKAFTSPSEAEDFVRAALDSHLGSVAGVDGPPPPPCVEARMKTVAAKFV